MRVDPLELTDCPVCTGSESLDTVRRGRLPTMQNYVFRRREAALAAAQGQLVLTVCHSCGFAWNRTFEPDRLVYDEGYDNAVPSAVMRAYYRDLAAYLGEKHDLAGGLIVDVGCGDGTFLRTICDAVPGSRGLGVDPALARDSEEDGGRIVLVKDVFSAAVIEEQPSLILSRHVLEHIPSPVAFLQAIRDAVSRFDPCPCFFEVPDLEWILANDAFWDFCYEHCSYFTAASFTTALSRAGLGPVGARAAFGAQYLWLEASSRGEQRPAGRYAAGDDLAERARAYATAEAAKVTVMRDHLRRLKSEGWAIAVWGMATKGVLFSILVDPDASLVDFCVDVNTNKQGCYVPLTGHPITAPAAMRAGAGSRRLAVLVMNENYRDEIRRTCNELGLDPSLIDVTAAPH